LLGVRAVHEPPEVPLYLRRSYSGQENATGP
jgi:hypothetical protein